MSSSSDEPRSIETGWDTVVLVCGACRKRSSGPKKSKAEAIVDRLRSGLRRIRPRPRLVTTGCLGPCPRKAITVVAPGAGGKLGVWAVASAEEADVVAERMTASS